MAYDARHSRQPPPSSMPSNFDDSRSRSRMSDNSGSVMSGSRSNSRVRASSSSARREEYPERRQSRQPVPQANEAANTSSQRNAPPAQNQVSPELIAEITEKITKELLDKLRTTSNVESFTQEVKTSPPMRRAASVKSNVTPSSPPDRRGVYTPPSPAQPMKRSIFPPSPPPVDSNQSPPGSFSDNTTAGSEEIRSAAAQNDASKSRPKGLSHRYSAAELSTIDQKWGRLFDRDDVPTPRLGQFLRGLANHMINHWEPTKTIIITPEKMAAFYANYNVENEVHPMKTIFQDYSNSQISQLYQDLECEHHLVQVKSYRPPVVPGLTPVGFQQWMTICLRAHPNEESKRLEKLVMDMPIDADGQMVDGKPERLPKQISRHLLPGDSHRKSRHMLSDAVLDLIEDDETPSGEPFGKSSPLSRRPSEVQRRPQQPQAEMPMPPLKTPSSASSQPPLERERMPYSGLPSISSDNSTVEDTLKIERERQPYATQPGNKPQPENMNATAATTAAPQPPQQQQQPMASSLSSAATTSSSSASVPTAAPSTSSSTRIGRAKSVSQTSRPREADNSPIVSFDRNGGSSSSSGGNNPSTTTSTNRHQRANSNASGGAPFTAWRGGGVGTPHPATSRRPSSPPLQRFSNSTPGNIESQNQGSYVPPPPPPPPPQQQPPVATTSQSPMKQQQKQQHQYGAGKLSSATSSSSLSSSSSSSSSMTADGYAYPPPPPPPPLSQSQSQPRPQQSQDYLREREARESRDREDRERDIRDRDFRERENRDREIRDRETRDREMRDRETRDREMRDRETRDRGIRDRETRDRENRERDNRDRETRDRDIRERESREADARRSFQPPPQPTQPQATASATTRDPARDIRRGGGGGGGGGVGGSVGAPPPPLPPDEDARLASLFGGGSGLGGPRAGDAERRERERERPQLQQQDGTKGQMQTPGLGQPSSSSSSAAAAAAAAAANVMGGDAWDARGKTQYEDYYGGGGRGGMSGGGGGGVGGGVGGSQQQQQQYHPRYA